ncbi:hypothetical protein BDV23DRAFT_175314 [Aspergillus alliaceus]|uniref:Uncharacterized protein n=1 Tax=Petromyces alliaceus TaxID=209559 RepID=A0A5N7BYQ7_PETAA|nr:uncharacterized protein BDW43DRAFT_300802 [Aspergillus alliaceus]KAB8232727.1 hypothetical protein BDW43DRAFT_300802 [Aspergillus alliaceus]KAE8386617.1 hypothetical protein BDV23DRAFT_175314 [Aspergillus alliaceus]
MTNPAVVICHGSYHSPAPYEPFIRHLQSQGFESYCPHRPTCNLSELNVGDVEHPDLDQEPPLGGYPSDTADVDEVIQLLDRLVNQNGKRVLLVAHSSGIFYMGAFVIPVGESVSSFFQPKDATIVAPPYMRFHIGANFI